jgi:hypothetical protein
MSDAHALITRFAGDRWLAHRHLFAHRHTLRGKPVAPAEFHEALVRDFWAPREHSLCMAFRGSAKSTLGEEDITLAAVYGSFHNIILLGSSETRAAERLTAVKHELDHNEYIQELFGPQRGAASDTWTQTKIVTARGVCIQAIGRDQDIRGIKFLDYRPDFVFVDDFEDKDNVQTPEGRARTLRWFLAEFLPACAPGCKVRIRATPMDAEAVPLQLQRAGWHTETYPIMRLDENGAPRATWPAAFDLAWIAERRRLYERLGEIATWEREYMCEAMSSSDAPFRPEQMRVVPRVKTWQAASAMIDPARTTGRNSATTGWAVWSWMSSRLVVWGADAHLLLPDEIIALTFEIAERFDPVWLGVEADGLEQFLMQPLRREQARRGIVLPVKAVRAPRGKFDFIRGLQPFFSAGEVEFAQEMPALKEQLLNFPRGRIDAPNALAYALQMRPGAPLLENFRAEHVVEDPEYSRDRPLFLAANATQTMVVAALVQIHDGRLVVLADWLMEGAPSGEAARIWTEATAFASSVRVMRAPRSEKWGDMLKDVAPDSFVTRGRAPSWVVPPHHADRFLNVGLMQAARAIPSEVRIGGDGTAGRAWLDGELAKSHRGMPVVEISSSAKWTLRALAGGYSLEFRRGRLQEYAEEGPYRLLMEAIEAFCGMARAGVEQEADDEEAENYSYDRAGRRYKSAMPARQR